MLLNSALGNGMNIALANVAKYLRHLNKWGRTGLDGKEGGIGGEPGGARNSQPNKCGSCCFGCVRNRSSPPEASPVASGSGSQSRLRRSKRPLSCG